MKRGDLERLLSLEDPDAHCDPDRTRAALEADPKLAEAFPEVLSLLVSSRVCAGAALPPLERIVRHRRRRRLAAAAGILAALLLLWRGTLSRPAEGGAIPPSRPVPKHLGVPASTAVSIEHSLHLRSRVLVTGRLDVARTPGLLARSRRMPKPPR